MTSVSPNRTTTMTSLNGRTGSLSPARATRPNSSPVIDDTLHCILVYRRTTAPLILCKHDVSSDPLNAHYAGTMIKMIADDPPESIFSDGVLGGFKVVQNHNHQVVYGQDSERICCAVVTGLKYKSRVSIQLLNDLYSNFMAEFEDRALEATKDHDLENDSMAVMENIVKLYADHKMVVMKRKDGSSQSDQGSPLLLSMSPASSMTVSPRDLGEMKAASDQFLEKEEHLSDRMEAKRRRRAMYENIAFCVCLLLVLVAVTAPIIAGVLKKGDEYEEIMAETEKQIAEGQDPVGVP
jgi:hypothetical protein